MLFRIFSSKSLIGLFAIAGFYAFVFLYTYENFTVEFFTYLIGGYSEPTFWHLAIYYICSILPFLFYKGFISIASGISFFVYILTYVPFLASLCVDMDLKKSCLYSVSCALFMSVVFRTDKLSIRLFNQFNSRKYSYGIIERITAVLLVFLFFRFIGQLAFVNILTQSDEMYDLRGGRGFDTISAYLVLWTNYVFLPICLITNLYKRNKIKLLLVLGGYLLVFMIDLQKITFLMPFVLIGLFYASTYIKKFSSYFHSVIILVLSITCIFLYSICEDNESVLFPIAAIAIMRTMHVGAWISTLYIDFFNNNPFTYWGHVGIINRLFHNYPYGETPLGIVVGEHMNANANFLVTDGFSSCGIIGVLLIFLVFIVFKSIMNNIGKSNNYIYCSLILIPSISALSNASLFSSLFSFGFILHFLIFQKIDFSEITAR